MFIALFVLFITGTLFSVHSSPTIDYPRMRVVNGTTSSIRKYPFMAAITSSGLCGCVFINNKWLLTAAHCVKANKTYIVRYGSIARSGRYSSKIKRTIIHPKSKGALNDIALIELIEAVKFNLNTAAITLPSKNFNLSKKPQMRTAVLLGWGLNRDGGSLQTKLQEVTVNVLTDSACKRLVPRELFYRSPNELCAFTRGKGQGRGDSGGPLVYYDKILIGIVSRSTSPKGQTPGIYTRVAHYIDWIHKYIN